jgi:hypothetical protein
MTNRMLLENTDRGLECSSMTRSHMHNSSQEFVAKSVWFASKLNFDEFRNLIRFSERKSRGMCLRRQGVQTHTLFLCDDEPCYPNWCLVGTSVTDEQSKTSSDTVVHIYLETGVPKIDIAVGFLSVVKNVEAFFSGRMVVAARREPGSMMTILQVVDNAIR